MTEWRKRAFAAAVAVAMFFCGFSATALSGAPGENEVPPHDHIAVMDGGNEPVMTEDGEAYAAATCVRSGWREFYVRCGICGKEIPGSRVRKEIPADENLHQPGPTAIEIVVRPSCVKEGSYFEVVRCQLCGKELSRKLVSVGKNTAHVPQEPVQENIVSPTCVAVGGYDSVIRCGVCGIVLSRTRKTIPKTDHISAYSLKRTVIIKEYEETDPESQTVLRKTGYFLSFEDKKYPDLKLADSPGLEALVGKAIEAHRFFLGDGKKRTCADGEERCALCGERLSEALPHTWDAGTVIAPATETTPSIIRYTCLIRGCGAEYERSSTPVLRVIVTLLNKLSGKYNVYDLDCDERITPAEARAVLRYSVGYRDKDGYIDRSIVRYVDVDRDGKVTPADARLYLRAAVGLTTA